MVARAGREMGSTSCTKMRSWLAPSTLPDSMISSGTVVWKKVRMMIT